MDNFTLNTEYAEFSLSDLKIPLAVSGEWAVKTHGHFSYEIHFILKGEATVNFQNKSVRVKEGEAILIAPNVFHYVEKTDSVERTSLRFSVEKKGSRKQSEFERYHEALEAAGDMAVVPFDKRAVGKLIKVKRERYLSDFFTRKIFGLNLLALIISVLGGIKQAKCGAETESPTKMSASELLETRKIQIEMWYENNFCAPSVADLARTLCLGVKQTERVVKSATGKTFKRYLYEYRMKRAGYLIKVDGLPLSQTAADVGYSSESVFRHAFTGYYGVSPEKYAQKE